MGTTDAELIALGDDFIAEENGDSTEEEFVDEGGNFEEESDTQEIVESESTDDSVEDPEADAEFDDVIEENDTQESEEPVNEANLYDVKINGETIQVTEADLIKSYSTGKASQSKFDEASAIKQQAELTLQNMKDDPMSTLQAMGYNLRDLSEKYLASQLDIDNMTDDQYENYQMKQQLEQMRVAEKDREQQEIIEKTNTAQQEYISRINTALTAVEIPVNNLTTRRMAYYMQEALKSDDPAVRDITDEQIAELVEEDYTNELRGYSEEKLGKMLGKEVVAKAKGKRRVTKPVKGVVKRATKTKMNSEQWNDYLDNLK